MVTPGGIPWYALVLQEPVLLAAGIAIVLAFVGLVAWIGSKSTGGQPSWRLNALVIGPVAALIVGGAAHWLQTRAIADVHTAGEWALMPRDASMPSARFWCSDNPGGAPRRSLSLTLGRPVERGVGVHAASPTFLPASDPATWPARIQKEIRTLYPDMNEVDAAGHAATISGWVSFLSSIPPPVLSQSQQRATNGPYNVLPTVEPVQRLRPWRWHWVVTIALGLLTMLCVTMYMRRRSRLCSPPLPA